MPKWANKGHEFDELGNYFKEHNEIVILGFNSSKIEKIRERLSFLGQNAPIKTIYVNPLLYQLVKNFIKFTVSSNAILVIADDSSKIFDNFLQIQGFTENKNIFLESNFFKKYLSIYALYCFDKLYSPYSTAVVVTTLCTLNCKYCLNYQPYIKNKQHSDYNMMISDIDKFFNVIDYTEFFSFTGGEPLLNKKTPELIKYVYKKYRNKYGKLGTATNGTIVLDEQTLNVFKETNAELLVDDYRKNVPSLKSTYEEIIKQCKDKGLNYIKGNSASFFKTFPPAEDYSKLSDEELIEKFDRCQELYSGFALKDGKFYACCYSSFIETAGVIESADSDYLDLNQEIDKKVIMEFILGYTDKGFAKLCKYCNCFFADYGGGYDEGGATQQHKNKLLEWDINNPTEYIEKHSDIKIKN